MHLRTVLAGLALLAAAFAQEAPGAPGAKPAWNNGNKHGVGTSVTGPSKVWFTLGDGALQEVYYPTVAQPNTRALEFAVTDGGSFAELESVDCEHRVELADPEALVFRQVNISKRGRYRITKTYVTDPQRSTVLIEVRFEPLVKAPLRLFVVFDPSLANSGMHDAGAVLGRGLVASEKDVATALVTSLPLRRASVGYAGTSDGWTALQKDYRLRAAYAKASDGNIVEVAELSPDAARVPFSVALAFGDTPAAAYRTAILSLQRGFAAVRAQYAAGWHAYVRRLAPVDPEFTRQYRISAMVLKAHEDKTHRGAGVASLTIPWGNEADASEPLVAGYHLVWSRDLYQVATAYLAAGDRQSAEDALTYLFAVQQRPDGSFPQNAWLDGRAFSDSLQLDEVAYPLLLAYQLARFDRRTYEEHVRPAAEFLVAHGPATPQERWEEKPGYSPSTIAAEIAGLVCAAEIARHNGDEAARARWLATARAWRDHLPEWTITTTGRLAPRYFLRLTQRGADTGDKIALSNGAGSFDEREIVDAGFLELVRLGIYPPDDPTIAASVAVVDQQLKVETPNGAAWHRYTHDGYGEHADGSGFNGSGAGRLWPLLGGERGEYELARGGDARPFLRAMQRMANDGGMLSEQVWDLPESPQPWLRFGEGTGSATPLAWTNAQFVRLARAVALQRLPETPQAVVDFFRARTPSDRSR